MKSLGFASGLANGLLVTSVFLLFTLIENPLMVFKLAPTEIT